MPAPHSLDHCLSQQDGSNPIMLFTFDPPAPHVNVIIASDDMTAHPRWIPTNTALTTKRWAQQGMTDPLRRVHDLPIHHRQVNLEVSQALDGRTQRIAR